MTSIATVLSWQPDQLSGVVDELIACRRTLVDLQDELAAGAPPPSWVSAAAALAGPAHQELGDSLADIVAGISSVLTAVDTESESLVLACRQLEDAVEHARSSGFTVDTATGEVVDARPSDDLTENEAGDRQAQCNEIVDRIEQALRNAVNADSQLAAVLDTAATGLDAGGSDLSDASDAGASQGTSDVLPPPDGGAADQNAWWNGLTEAEQLDVIANEPRWVGNTDGIPAWARDQANRSLIDDYRSELEDEADRLQKELDDNWFGGTFTSDDSKLEDVKNKLKGLDEIEKTLALGGRQLLLLDPDSGQQLHAAVANGNIDTADHVAAFTPGLTSTVQDSLGNYDADMNDLQSRAQDESDKYGDGGSVATVTWLGYDAPQMGMDLVNPGRSVLNDDLAKAGAGDLNDFYNGIDASRDTDPHLTALGHSYGSLTTSIALQEQNGVDDMAIFGSPGLGTSDIGDIDVPPDHAFRIEAKGDPVADGGVFGIDPSHMDGMTGLSAKDAELADEKYDASGGHSEYLNGDTTSQHNMASLIAGSSDRLVYDDGRGAGDVLSWPVPGTY